RGLRFTLRAGERRQAEREHERQQPRRRFRSPASQHGTSFDRITSTPSNRTARKLFRRTAERKRRPARWRAGRARAMGPRVRIAVCLRGAARILASLRAELPQDEIFECAAAEVEAAARESEVLVPTISPVGESALAAPTVRLVQQFGAGLDAVDVAAASRL